jgi:AraC family transcriptional regulator of adaptative response/methylated-DNA-[protein]-cysteine methyltransferase
MTYRITGIDPAPYRHLYGLSDEELASRGIVRMTVTEKPSFPCRVSLTDRDLGESVLLLNHVSHDVANPYRASHAIFVSEGAEAAAEYVDEVPPVFTPRVLSLRAFDKDGMMAEAVLAQPGEADAAIRKLFDNPAPMDNVSRLDADTAWAAFMRRDRAWDGHVIGAVKTTGIYCKPSCPARRPKREHVEFFASAEEARAAGYRSCMRCKPDEVGRDREAVAQAVKLIEQAEGAPTLDELATAVGYAPHHFQRIFKRDLGVSPAEYARGLRNRRTEAALKANGRVTDAVYDAGYSGPSSFYSDAKERLGMTPSAWRNGGHGETIRWTHFDSPLGQMLIAATSKGICRLTFDDNEQSLRRLFPNATLVEDAGGLRDLVEGALAAIDSPLAARELPIDVAGTAFQEAVWRELRKIPAGETRSYAQIAAAIGQPKAVRAVGTANGDNHVAVLIPCHRVIRSDGTLGGYAGGLDRKRKLLAAERAGPQPELGL